MVELDAVHDFPDGALRFSFSKPQYIDIRTPHILVQLLLSLQDFSGNAGNLDGNEVEFICAESGAPVVLLAAHSTYTAHPNSKSDKKKESSI